MSTTATIRLDEHEKETLVKFAEFNGMTFSDWARQTMLEAVEDFMDYQAAVKAHEEFERNPVSYSPEEVARILGDKLGDA